IGVAAVVIWVLRWLANKPLEATVAEPEPESVAAH
ncbi:MAG: hypothetical protein QOJ12_1389, partial [Thermoleophilales bacterium]|nr:hypothetical protein [Thermoleophilales bacterium]